MDDLVLICLVFGIGILVQSFLLIKVNLKEHRKKYLWAILISFAGVLGFARDGGESLYAYILTYFLFFSIVYAGMFKKEILPVINEAILLFFTIIILYLSYFYFSFVFNILLVPALLVFICSFTNIKLPGFWKVMGYVWFLVINIVLIIFQFKHGNLYYVFQGTSVSLYEIFFTGMTFLYFVANVMCVLEFVPLPSKHQTFSQKMAQIKDHIKIITAKFSDYQIRLHHSLIVIVLTVGILLGNYYLQLVPDNTIVNISIIVVYSFYSNV